MKLRLIYFNFPFWRAEVSRISLFIGGVNFEDIRVTSEDFAFIKENGKMKDGTIIPFRQLPVLEIDGQSIAQTGAIARICGKLGGLYPKDDLILSGEIDQIIDFCTDINNLLRPSFKETDPIIRKKLREELIDGDLTYKLKLLDKMINHEFHWAAGTNISIADIALWRFLGWLQSGIIDHIPKEICKPFANLTNIFNEVDCHPKVKEWVLKTYNN